MSKTATYFTVIVIILVIIIELYFIIMAMNNQSANPVETINNIQTEAPAKTINISSSASSGSFLADANGKTLYYFVNDTVGKSNCTGQCQTSWPIFYSPNIVASSQLDISDFGQIKNENGQNQTTYYGWPLYYYAGDNAPGDTNGQGLQNIWFVVANPEYNVLLMNNPVSKIYLSDNSGKALYYFKSDIKGTATSDPLSKCTGACLATWPIFSAPGGGQITAPALLKISDFKEFTRPDGTSQLSYKGWPLYSYSKDIKSGDTKGDAFNNLWYLVKP